MAIRTHVHDSTGTRTKERGYALALTALLLIPLMAITAIGVDIGVWYLQGSRNQRIADAAALAGAVWLPDQAKAESVAIEAIEKNGLNPGVDSSIDVAFTSNFSLKVTVSTVSELSFSGAFINEFAITRSAVAEYAPPVALGSPNNGLGAEGLWLAISGECSVRENGDLRSARWLAGYPGGAYPPTSCNTGVPNPDYSGEYILAVTVDQVGTQPIRVQVYDGTFAPSAAKSTDLSLHPPATFDTTFTLYDAPGPPFDLAGHAVLSSTTFPAYDAASDAAWTTIGIIPTPEVGTYYLRVSTEGSGGNQSYGSNGFAVRAFSGGSYSFCTTLGGDPAYDPTCPQVSAVKDLPLFASLSNGSAEFYLAEIASVHAGKQLEITLFDVGEGAERIEILDPNGAPVDFAWSTDCSVTAATPGCAGVAESWTWPADGTFHAYTLDVSGTGQQIYLDTLSDSTWNDRKVVVTLDIPIDYATAYAARWWRVRYFFGTDITDRTTWSVRVIGDPVRLAG